MTSTPGALQHLPPSTQSKLRSSQILTSLPQVVYELVQNSLDAGAEHVEIGVDCEEWSCWVRDDGRGMSKSELTALVNSGRYSTSKAYTPASLDEVTTFGFRGEALASITDLCCLEISSRTQRSRDCWSVILKGGNVVYNGTAVRWRRESPGTVVCVRDAFYNLPIRRLSHPSAQRTVDLIRKDLEALALVFPQVSFSLENTNRLGQNRAERGRVISIPKILKTPSPLQAFRHLFGRALVEHVDEIGEIDGNISINGFISVEGSPSRAYQYLYVNRHLLSLCDLHRIIDSSFASSSFSKHALDEYREQSHPLSSTRRSPKKSDKKPVYVLDITVPPREVDNCLEPAKAAVHLQNSEAVASLLSSVIHSFLVRHGFKSDTVRRPAREDAPPRKRRRVDRACSKTVPLRRSVMPVVVPEEDEEGDVLWTDHRTGETYVVDRRTGNSYPVHALPGDENQNPAHNDRVGVGVGGAGGRRTLASRPTLVKMNTKATQNQDKTETPKWLQDALGANDAYAIGASKSTIPALSLSTSFADDVGEWQRQRQKHKSGGRSGDTRHTDRHGHGLSSHVARFSKASLKDARVLGQVDRKFIACVIQASPVNDRDRDHDTEDDNEVREEEEKGTPTLVLVDQHAADERVRVERLLDELCASFGCVDLSSDSDAPGSNIPGIEGPPVVPELAVRILRPPVAVLLTRHEAEQLAGSPGMRRAFGLWGVQFVAASLDALARPDGGANTNKGKGRGKEKEKDREREDSGYAQITVESVPEVVANKLLEGHQLRDLIKSYIAELVASGNLDAPVSASQAVSTSTSTSAAAARDREHAASGGGWQRTLRHCPRALHELVNSKACRGAIMFNDPLAHERCVRLVRALAGAALPFQCAHGRPSLVPLASLIAEVGERGRTSGGRGIAYSRHLEPVDWARFVAEQDRTGHDN